MNVRVLNESDAQLYRKIRLNSLKNNPESFASTYQQEVNISLDIIKLRLQSSTNDRFVLGYFGEHQELQGIITFVREDNFKTLHKANVYGMYVTPEMRGKGIGKILMLELIRRAKKCDGLEQVNLTVVANNHFAKCLYESVGFVVYGHERNALKFEGRYYDEDLMVLSLLN